MEHGLLLTRAVDPPIVSATMTIALWRCSCRVSSTTRTHADVEESNSCLQGASRSSSTLKGVLGIAVEFICSLRANEH